MAILQKCLTKTGDCYVIGVTIASLAGGNGCGYGAGTWAMTGQ